VPLLLERRCSALAAVQQAVDPHVAVDLIADVRNLRRVSVELRARLAQTREHRCPRAAREARRRGEHPHAHAS
jgi:hypothetical protein